MSSKLASASDCLLLAVTSTTCILLPPQVQVPRSQASAYSCPPTLLYNPSLSLPRRLNANAPSLLIALAPSLPLSHPRALLPHCRLWPWGVQHNRNTATGACRDPIALESAGAWPGSRRSSGEEEGGRGRGWTVSLASRAEEATSPYTIAAPAEKILVTVV
eukprot:765305-Hanusia_phi.AAC.1